MATSLVAGALFHHDHGGLGLYVKYGNTGVDDIRIIERTNAYFWAKTPDREIVGVMDGHRHFGMRPLDCNFDEYISVSPFHSSFRDWGIQRIMVNMPQHLDKMWSSPEVSHKNNPNMPKVISDSGGFQIARERIGFLHPEKVAEWYNANVDEGITLDIPPGYTRDEELLRRCAHIQNINTDIIESNLDGSVDLFNVFHTNDGNIESFRTYRDLVERDSLDRVCIAGLYRGNMMKTISNLADIAFEGKRYPHYHALGIYNVAIMVNIIKLSQLFDLNITTDASTHLQSARNRMYHQQRLPDEPVRRLVIGENGRFNVPSPHRHLPCSCPVCSGIKYMDLLALLPGACSTFLLAAHNMWENNRYVEMMNRLCVELSSEDYSDLVYKQLQNHQTRDTAMAALRFIDEIKASGIKKAQQKFSYFLADEMFETGAFDEELGQIDTSTGEWITQIHSVIDKYETNLGSGAVYVKGVKHGAGRGKIMHNGGHRKKPVKSHKKIKAK